MCGISGIISFHPGFKKTEGDLYAFSAFNKYRGPDEFGMKINQSNGLYYMLAHHRLSILDLTPTGCQPMTNEAGDIAMIYNGEVFNFMELKNELLKSGIKFNGTSDTEVILKAYENWGIDKTLGWLEGMFALCIIDTQKQTVFIARDPFGKKPLYFCTEKGIISFSSDLRSFKRLNIPLSINIEALSYYFSELSTPEQSSIFNEIKKVIPGTYLKINEDGIRTITFKKLSFKRKEISEAENIETHVDNLIQHAVKTRLVADVPVVTFLSGGIDSGLITAMAAMNYGKKISTYTVGYENYPFDERPFAKLVAQKYNTDHHEIILNPQGTDIIEKLIEEFGEPFADSSMIPSYYVCSALSSKAKVALSGDGGDELFLGYPTYVQAARMQEIYNKAHWLSPVIHVAAKVTGNPRLSYVNGITQKNPKTLGSALYRNMGFNKKEITTLFGRNPRAQNAMENEFTRVIENGAENYNNVFSAIWYGTFKTRLINDYLVKVDRASMFASVEVRSPFLDDQLQQYVCSLPHEKLMPGAQSKYLLKQLAKKYLPQEILTKPKTGFGIPVGEWFRDSWKQKFIETVLINRQTKVELDYTFIEKLFNEHLEGQRHDDKIWALYVFHYWCQSFFGE